MSVNTLSLHARLIDAVRVIESTAKRLAVVLSDDQQVLGTLTDGDVRRSLLHDGSLGMSVTEVMNREPVTADVDSSDNYLIQLLSEHNIRSLPLVDHEGSYVRVVHFSELQEDEADEGIEQTFAAAVVMAGGEGTRLRPLTETIPKPMVDINGVPLLERQIHKLKKAGIQKIFISVNYLKQIIIDHFGDGSDYGVEGQYLHEDKKLGTAGALALMSDFQKSGPIIVLNGDVLTTSDFVHLYHFHVEHRSTITISAIDYHVEIPYGVIASEGVSVVKLLEKPSQRFFCNAGIYALSPSALGHVPQDEFFHMTDLVEKCLETNLPVAVFPVYEYWSDIGTPADLDRARKEFRE